MALQRYDRKSYSLGWISALPLEFTAAITMFDERHSPLPQGQSDNNTYAFGRIGSYHVIMACLPSGVYGVTSAAVVATHMRQSFPNIEAALLVGIAGGAPNPPDRDIRLGDVVVSEPVPGYGGVLQYDFGKTVQAGRFVQTGVLNKPPKIFLTATATLKAESQLQRGSQLGSEACFRRKNSVYVDNIIADALKNGGLPPEFGRPPNHSDRLFEGEYDHPSEYDSCDSCDSTMVIQRGSRLNDEPYLHYGLIASGNQVMKHGLTRDLLIQEKNVFCFEMEAAGVMDEIPSLVIRGICDYSDSHKNKVWQPYAALSAAAFAKELIRRLPFRGSEKIQPEGIVLNLPIAEGAAYESYANQHKSGCLAGTRVELLKILANWIDNPEGKPIFWLLGKAGTGKSTISRTVAENLTKDGRLAGSFFFNREEGDRRTGARFLTTIATQLANYDFEIGSKIQKATRVDPLIFTKSLTEQFQKLIFEPLAAIQRTRVAGATNLVLVIDALDECEKPETIKLIIHLLGQLKDLETVDMRVFLTSREELPIIISFNKLPGSTYENTALHEIPHIQEDIALFLQDEFDKIREERDDAFLPEIWPSKANLEKLVKRATPLFIYAATLCKFIGDQQWDPDDQMKIVLDYQTEWQTSQLQITYLPVLNQLVVDQSPSQQRILIQQFRQVVGTIINLASPMWAPSLARLLSLHENTVRCRLRPLQSVLDIPKDPDGLIRTFHLSFRDFLLDRCFQEMNQFWIDESESHKLIASRCIELMSDSDGAGLRRNICNLPSPGTLRSEIDGEVIRKRFSPELRYACRYWISHIVRSGHRLIDNGQTHIFLQKHLLHWLEATCLLDLRSEVLRAIEDLRTIINTDNATGLNELMYDIWRFMLNSQGIIYKAPLQTYVSALIFTPKKSIIRTIFDPSKAVPFLRRFPYVRDAWGPTLQSLEMDAYSIPSVAFSPDGKMLASAGISSIRLWDTITGSLLTTLEPVSLCTAALFSPDGRLLAVSSKSSFFDERQIILIQLWDISTESILKELTGHHSPVNMLAFSPDNNILASASHDKSVKLWNCTTGTLMRTLGGHNSRLISIAFAPDNGQKFTSVSSDGAIGVWETDTGNISQMPTKYKYFPIREGSARIERIHDDEEADDDDEDGVDDQATESITAAAISPKNNSIIAFALRGEPIQIWNTSTATLMQTFEQKYEQNTEDNYSVKMAFSPDSKILASVNRGDTTNTWDPNTASILLQLWDVATGALLQFCTWGFNSFMSERIVFSPNGRMLAVPIAATVELLDTTHTGTITTGAPLTIPEEHTHRISWVALSPGGTTFATSSYDTTIKLWGEEGNLLRTIEGNDSAVINVLFSPNAEMLASIADDSKIRLWNVATGALLHTLDDDYYTESKTLYGQISISNYRTIFSYDSKVLGVLPGQSHGSTSRRVLLWDTATGMSLEILRDGDGAKNSPFFFNYITNKWTDSNGQPLNIFPSFGIGSLSNISLYSVNSNITTRDDWLIRGGERLIWLPHDRRKQCWDREGSRIVLGHTSSLFSYFHFKTPFEEI